MPISVDLGKKLESTVSKLVTKGRYNSKSEVLREGVRLVEEREKAFEKLDAELEVGLADIRAGRVHTSEEVWPEVRKRMRDAIARQAKKSA